MFVQRYTDETVLEAARRRIAWTFDQYERVFVSISGGKDSTVLCHLALLEAKARGRRVGLFFIDEEVVYQSTVDQVDYLMSLYPEATDRWWLQIPFALDSAMSSSQPVLQCWHPGQHKIWMRAKRDDAIKARPWDSSLETVRSKEKGLGFYDIISTFPRMFPGAAFLVGLRAAGESPNRWRAVTKNPIEINGQRIFWGTHRENTDTLYPIYDWNAHDVWRYIADQELKYSKVYDWQFRKGYPLTEMRVSSLIHEKSFRAIADLQEFEPKTYARLLKRIKGVALTQETAKSAKMMAVRKLPARHESWSAYRDYLLETHPSPEMAERFRARFSRHLNNEYVARQQVRQIVLNDYENNLPVHSAEDPRDALIAYYRKVL